MNSMPLGKCVNSVSRKESQSSNSTNGTDICGPMRVESMDGS